MNVLVIRNNKENTKKLRSIFKFFNIESSFINIEDINKIDTEKTDAVLVDMSEKNEESIVEEVKKYLPSKPITIILDCFDDDKARKFGCLGICDFLDNDTLDPKTVIYTLKMSMNKQQVLKEGFSKSLEKVGNVINKLNKIKFSAT